MALQMQLRNGTLQEWETFNPILAEGEMGVVLEPSGGFVIGDGKNSYKDLPFHPWAQDSYDILVTYGGYKGTKEDFCRQLDSSLRLPEQQAGTFANAGSGWNSFTFPKEFAEDVYVVLTPKDAAVFASVKNITKQGFLYCLFNASGNTIAQNVQVVYMATAVSELNMAQAIAKASGLNPFDFDNLTDLFAGHAAEVVASEAAFGMVKRSAMASARNICHLTGLNPVSYFNMVSIAGNVTAMETVARTPEAVAYIQTAPGAYDSIRLGTIPMAKYLCGILNHEPENYSTVTDILEDEELLAELVLSEAAMTALSGSSISAIELSASDVAMQAVAASDVASDAIFNNDSAFTVILESPVAMAAISDSEPAITSLIQSQERCNRLASSETAMSAVAASETAMISIISEEKARETFFGSKYKVGLGLATYAKINNSALKGCNTISLVAASSTAMQAVAASSTALNAIVKVVSACQAIVTNISTYRSQILSALSSGNEFTKTTGQQVGNGNTTVDHGLNTNTIYIPTSCQDDGDTDMAAYSGVNQTTQIVSVGRHNGETAVNTGVALRGVKVVGTGSSVGYFKFDIYTAK